MKGKLKDKFETIHFPVEEKHWNDMEKLLDKRRRRRAAFRIFFIGMPALAIISSIILFNTGNSKTTSSGGEITSESVNAETPGSVLHQNTDSRGGTAETQKLTQETILTPSESVSEEKKTSDNAEHTKTKRSDAPGAPVLHRSENKLSKGESAAKAENTPEANTQIPASPAAVPVDMNEDNTRGILHGLLFKEIPLVLHAPEKPLPVPFTFIPESETKENKDKKVTHELGLSGMLLYPQRMGIRQSNFNLTYKHIAAKGFYWSANLGLSQYRYNLDSPYVVAIDTFMRPNRGIYLDSTRVSGLQLRLGASAGYKLPLSSSLSLFADAGLFLAYKGREKISEVYNIDLEYKGYVPGFPNSYGRAYADIDNFQATRRTPKYQLAISSVIGIIADLDKQKHWGLSLQLEYKRIPKLTYLPNNIHLFTPQIGLYYRLK